MIEITNRRGGYNISNESDRTIEDAHLRRFLQENRLTVPRNLTNGNDTEYSSLIFNAFMALRELNAMLQIDLDVEISRELREYIDHNGQGRHGLILRDDVPAEMGVGPGEDMVIATPPTPPREDEFDFGVDDGRPAEMTPEEVQQLQRDLGFDTEERPVPVVLRPETGLFGNRDDDDDGPGLLDRAGDGAPPPPLFVPVEEEEEIFLPPLPPDIPVFDDGFGAIEDLYIVAPPPPPSPVKAPVHHGVPPPAPVHAPGPPPPVHVPPPLAPGPAPVKGRRIKPPETVMFNPIRMRGNKRAVPLTNYREKFEREIRQRTLPNPSDIDKVVVGGALVTIAAPLIPKCFCRCVCLA